MNTLTAVKYFSILILCMLLTFSVVGQQGINERRVLKNANSFFNNEEFDKALPLYLSIDSISNDDLVTYKIGACYLNSKHDKLKAIDYLEKSSVRLSESVPIDVFYDLGTLYHYIYKFDKAISSFNQYIKLSKSDEYASPTKVLLSEEMIKVCQNAMEITTKPYKADIQILPYPVNTTSSQFCPMISADESMMVYMQESGNDSPKENPKILLSLRDDADRWATPIELLLEKVEKYNKKEVLLAGLSPDGQTIFLNIGNGLNQDIYSGTISGRYIKDIEALNKEINSPFYEGAVSLSSDGTSLFFVSDRPGGLGGTDIYRAQRSRKGEWEKPVNLGNVINTPKDEYSPFLHPDCLTLFFSSDGHKTIGGKDIFKSKLVNNQWTQPENVGFPNSTKDDLYFVLNANGQTAYFSSSKNNLYNRHNIYSASLKDPIPLTLLKGTIKAGSPPKPVAAEVSVYDKESKEKIRFVYNPNPENGKYLMIFPPAKNYDIYIKAEQYLPQLINVYIPYQTYFYELFQEVTLKPIHIGDKMVGEEVTVNNVFYDIFRTSSADSILEDNSPKRPEYYDHLLELVEKIIETTDTNKISYNDHKQDNEQDKQRVDNLLNMIEKAIETTDAATLKILDANVRKNNKVTGSHFFTDSNKISALKPVIMGNDTLYVASPIDAVQPNQHKDRLQVEIAKEDNLGNNIRKSKLEERKYIYQLIIYYPTGKFDISQEYFNALNDVSDLLIDKSNLGAEILGYTDQVGEEKFNLTLSRQRAQQVLKYLLDRKVNSKKMIAKGLGEAEIPMKAPSDSQEGRRVEINVFELR